MEDILMHGVPLEFDTAANKSHHTMSKVAAKLTQQNETTFNFQVALRMWEFHILLDLAIHELRMGRQNSDCFDIFSDQSAKCPRTVPTPTKRTKKMSNRLRFPLAMPEFLCFGMKKPTKLGSN